MKQIPIIIINLPLQTYWYFPQWVGFVYWYTQFSLAHPTQNPGTRDHNDTIVILYINKKYNMRITTTSVAYSHMVRVTVQYTHLCNTVFLMFLYKYICQVGTIKCFYSSMQYVLCSIYIYRRLFVYLFYYYYYYLLRTFRWHGSAFKYSAKGQRIFRKPLVEKLYSLVNIRYRCIGVRPVQDTGIRVIYCI